MTTLLDEVNLAYEIIFVANVEALGECRRRRLDPVPAYTALLQDAMRRYADLLGSDMEAIQHIRGFLDAWAADASMPSAH